MHSISYKVAHATGMAILLSAMGIGSVMLIGKVDLPTPSHCELQAITQSGDLYILGSGDTCRDAFINHAPYPANWREMKYQQINSNR